MTEDKVKVTLKKGHGMRVTQWGACVSGDSIEIPRDAALRLNRGVWDIAQSAITQKPKAKSGSKSTASGRG